MSKSTSATNQPSEVQAPNNKQRLFLAYTFLSKIYAMLGDEK
jgi:hypothetical protein